MIVNKIYFCQHVWNYVCGIVHIKTVKPYLISVFRGCIVQRGASILID